MDSTAHAADQATRAGSQQLRTQMIGVRDCTVDYIPNEPVKAVLIAAGVGAGRW